MENQYYAVVEKQDFFEIIENKFGELAIFIDNRETPPSNPKLEYNGDNIAILYRDEKTIIKLEGITAETRSTLAEAEVVLFVETNKDEVIRTYAVPVETVDEIVFRGKQVRADEYERFKQKKDIIEAFGAVNIWTNGEN
ncbi:MAG: hypothetical protein IKW39_01085 [Alphaproteobacteria bacterium]|nr:hypothetical protein [Alphaproteobacteria bacterium]